MLDERLSLAAQLYEPCALGADIGTDHALLPCYLLTHNICQEMILADVSPKALLHAGRKCPPPSFGEARACAAR